MTLAYNYNLDRVQNNLKVLLHLYQTKANISIDPTILKKYTGWGGLRDALYTKDVFLKLRNTLTDSQIQSLKLTLKSAYYTPEPIVEFIYAMIEKLGVKSKHILEPSVGHGIFIEKMPENMRKRAEITAVEIDEVSCKIIQSIYPDINLQQMGFENFQTGKRFDLIIGNPPYGSMKLKDEYNTDLTEHCIHHYFTAKCMRLLKAGGLLAFVLPSYFLDNQSKHVRKIIAEEGGSLLAAYRLPDDMFADAKVTVDVVFLVKEKPKKSWWKVETFQVDNQSTVINQYFIECPQHILGKLAQCQIYDRTGLTCKRDGDTLAKLNALLQTVVPINKADKPDIIATKVMLQQKLAEIEQTLIVLTQKRQQIGEALTRLHTYEQELGAFLTEVNPLIQKAA